MQTSPLLHFFEGNKGNKRCLRLEAIRQLPQLVGTQTWLRRIIKENVKKAIGLITKTTTLHVHYIFWYISLPLMHD